MIAITVIFRRNVQSMAGRDEISAGLVMLDPHS
jgi:hypothetical protein